jgi:hypothetical protein
MTLHLKKCVSFFVCLSLLLSACSPGKSSKASEFARITVDDEESAEEIDDYAPHIPLSRNTDTSADNNGWWRTARQVGIGAAGAALGAVIVGAGAATGFIKEGKELGAIKLAGEAAGTIGLTGLVAGGALGVGGVAGRAAARKFAKGPISAALAGAAGGGLAGAGMGAIGGAITPTSWHIEFSVNEGIILWGVVGLVMGAFAGGVDAYDAWYGGAPPEGR